jgi:hypothetical protein
MEASVLYMPMAMPGPSKLLTVNLCWQCRKQLFFGEMTFLQLSYSICLERTFSA